MQDKYRSIQVEKRRDKARSSLAVNRRDHLLPTKVKPVINRPLTAANSENKLKKHKRSISGGPCSKTLASATKQLSIFNTVKISKAHKIYFIADSIEIARERVS
jgi:hypothetical protein